MIVAQEKPNYSYAERSEPARRPKPQIQRDRGTRVMLTLLVVATFALGVALNLYCARTVQLGYRVALMKAEVAKLEAENQNLEAEVARLDSLERIESAAVTKLGMVPPTQDNVMFVAVKQRASAAGQDGQVTEPDNLSAAKTQGQGQGLFEALLQLVCRWEDRVRTG